MKNNASLAYSFFLIIGDFLALTAAFVSAYILRVKLDERPLIAEIAARDYLTAFLYIIPVWLIIFGLLGLYNKNVFENRFSEFGRLLVGCFLGILTAIGYEYVSGAEIFPARLVPVYGLGLAFAFVLLFRTIARAIRRSLFNFGFGVSNVLIVGDSDVMEFIHAMGNTRITGNRVVGIVGKSRGNSKYKHFASFAEATKALESVGIHSIIQTELYANADKNAEILAYTQENHVAYRFVPGNSELFSGNIDVDLFYSMPVIAVHQTALVGWGRIVKRLFDLSVSGLILIISSPLFLLIAIVSKLTDPKCPVLFKQKRLTRFNKEFTVYKFRSMHKEYGKGMPEDDFILMGRPDLAKKFRENNEQFDKDPRLTPIGKFLRRTSLDELPQLWNVFSGDISLVGPRALIAQELKDHKHRHLILSVKSGMTGLAVISGRKEIPFDERRKLDLYYVQNWSFWNDIVILAKTIAVVIFGRGVK